jgi:nitrous oxide reductase
MIQLNQIKIRKWGEETNKLQTQNLRNFKYITNNFMWIEKKINMTLLHKSTLFWMYVCQFFYYIMCFCFKKDLTNHNK